MTKEKERILLKITSIIRMCDKDKNVISSATCFFCKDKKDNSFFVTNNHVIEQSNYCLLYLTLKDTNNGAGYHDEVFCDIENHIYKHQNYDLCMVNINHIRDSLLCKKIEPIISYVPADKITSDFNEFNFIETIYMIGYPNRIINESINYPVIRKGITATGLCTLLNDMHAFIIDIPTYGGSSGSSIFVIEDDKIKLIGIVSEKYQEANYVHKKSGDKYIADTTERVYVPDGLGYAIKSNILLELLNSISD